MSLCHPCRRFDIHRFKGSNNSRDMLVETILAGNESGCSLCSLLHSDMETELAMLAIPLEHVCIELRLRSEHFRLESEPSFKPELNVRPSYTHLEVGIKRRPWKDYRGDSLWSKVYEYQLVVDPGAPICISCIHLDALTCNRKTHMRIGSAAHTSGDITNCYLGPDPGSAQHVHELRRLIDQCQSSHPRCRQTLSSAGALDPLNAPLPTRCIRVEDDGLSLCDTKNMFGSYITLSHRWNASTGTCKTTYANLSNRMEHIPRKSLSQSFLDTITLAKQLGITYICERCSTT